MTEQRVVAWFSCGVASAVAASLAIEKYGKEKVVVAYCDTMADEHPDNQRFFDEVQDWLGIKIKRLKSQKYNRVDEVFKSRSFMSGIMGAPCTTELKKMPRFDFQRADDIHVFGYTSDENHRITRFKEQNPDVKVDWVLSDQGYSKPLCLMTIGSAGIEIPMMYQLGYSNNNCLGCVKASSATYWNSIRIHFPDVFKARSDRSRSVGARLTRFKGERIFLDQLPADYLPPDTEVVSCGIECEVPEETQRGLE